MTTAHLSRVTVCCSFLAALAAPLQAQTLVDQARSAMRNAGRYWATEVASHGGYVWEYTTDFVTRRRGESGNLPLSTNWVQSPGTPAVGSAFLEAYKATGEKLYQDAAVAAARCLAWGQLKSGGWTYSIEHDLKRNRSLYHHLTEDKAADGKKLRNTTTFDDNNTQYATRFLMSVDQYVDDPKIDDALSRALACLLTAQYKEGGWDGAWAQRYPPPSKGYGAYPTYNDNTMSDCVRTMLMAYKVYGKPEYLASVKRCLEFYLRSQQPDPQGAWAQQYDREVKPAWARRFEPPSITGGESCGNCRLLMDMFIELGDARYLDAVGRAVDWYRRSRIGGTEKAGVWARFYEVGTNKPLYFTRTYKLVYTDDDLPVHYSFKSGYGVDSMMRRYEELKRRGRDELLAQRDRQRTKDEWAAVAERSAEKVQGIVASLDEKGRWVKRVPKREQVRDKEGRIGYEVDKDTVLDMVYSNTFIQNVRKLAEYVTAVQGGPKVEPAPTPSR